MTFYTININLFKIKYQHNLTNTRKTYEEINSPDNVSHI